MRLLKQTGQLLWRTLPDGQRLALGIRRGSAIFEVPSTIKKTCLNALSDKGVLQSPLKLDSKKLLTGQLPEQGPGLIPMVLEWPGIDSGNDPERFNQYCDNCDPLDFPDKPKKGNMRGSPLFLGDNLLMFAIPPGQDSERAIVVRVNGTQVVLSPEDIEWVEALLQNPQYHELLLQRVRNTLWLRHTDQHIIRSSYYLALNHVYLWLHRLLLDLEGKYAGIPAPAVLMQQLLMTQLFQAYKNQIPGIISFPDKTSEKQVSTDASSDTSSQEGSQLTSGAKQQSDASLKNDASSRDLKDPQNERTNIADQGAPLLPPPTLVIMAAGNGSRYGSPKQLDILPYINMTLPEVTIRNAAKAGIKKVVLIIREDLKQQVQDNIISRLPEGIEVQIVFQKLDDLPAGFQLDELPERNKPWGTAHAVWAARKVVNGSFVLLNADDYYGSNVFTEMIQGLPAGRSWAMVAYPLHRTLSGHGGVSRGICHINEGQQLVEVKEHYNLQRQQSRGIEGNSKDQPAVAFSDEQPVSMNVWGFQPDVFALIEEEFVAFLTRQKQNLTGADKEEFLLPDVVQTAISTREKVVRVYHSEDQWLGMTYRKDRESVGRLLHEWNQSTPPQHSFQTKHHFTE
ncbi:sugar phosphate nucleotidyltransferase [Endozoicomonas gorgoniicola]|uniref:Sugar phosphate nucleotidyltransferase n=1 Tax=Endozoicomonas gorgoniicola TaxID=1234144 RepID=A0ABT3MSY3_9GAMM|nr:sugar phosphate nucleotidyltransferase [Endozoicomonas gorgoniicola]MCW7552495.1 sugar phosphate nucleotidyltransferase [Endozoicomonas gorgoniicola]